jgi:hypothetical protein
MKLPQRVRPTVSQQLTIGGAYFRTEQRIVNQRSGLYVEFSWHHIVAAGQDDPFPKFEEVSCIGS